MWNEFIKETEITEKVTDKTDCFAKEFGKYLGTEDKSEIVDKNGRTRTKKVAKLTTSQLRKFFGEVKRQQMMGYNETSFVLLKPKLAYAVGRETNKEAKIADFYNVMSKAIDLVIKEDGKDKKMKFKNFILIFEAIVAYHKAAENNQGIF